MAADDFKWNDVAILGATPDKNADKLSASQVMDIAQLANLRMWDAYEKAGRA